MHGLSNPRYTLATIGVVLGTALGAASLQGCDGADGLCGPCGSVLEGQVSISGDARLDGFFAAVSRINDVFLSVRGDFETNIRALAAVWEFEIEGEVTAEVVSDLMAHIRAEIAANVEGGVQLRYAPPRCSAAVEVAVEAQASCEAQAECDVDVDPGMVQVSCEGTCRGSCEGTCEGAVSCQVEGGIQCEGTCEGACQLDVAAECSGTCRGECSGTCSLQNADGRCEGQCDGMCEGTCEVAGGAECSGTCHGSCVTETPSAECMATAECRGSCMGECGGSCEGKATPPSASAECEASADCQASAQAQASANFECSPPTLELGFTFAGNIDGAAAAEFTAKMTELRVRGTAILQGFAQLRGIVLGIDTNGDGEVDINVLADLRNSFEAVVNAGIDGELNIAAGKLPCLPDALRETGQIFTDIGAEGSATVEAQAEFLAGITALGG